MTLEEKDDGKTLTRVYQIRFDVATFTLAEARAANDGTSAVPGDGAGAGDGTDRVCTRREASRIKESGLDARVVLTYAVFDFGGNGKPEDKSTLDKWNVTVEAEGVSFVEGVNEDRDGKVVANTVGDPIDPLPDKERYDEAYTIAFTTGYVNRSALRDLRGKVNSDTVVMTIDGETDTFEPDKLKFGNAKWSRVIGDNSEKYFRVTIPMLYRADGWKRKFPNMGFNKLDGSNKVQITGDDNKPLANPAFLNAAGTDVLESGDDVYLVEFNIDDEAAFGPALVGIG